MADSDANGPSAGEDPEFDRLGFDSPHSARVYDFFLGGKTNYAIDREQGLRVLQGYPEVMMAARHNRDFMHRATRYLARERGLRQWLDIGTGIPTEPNLHQVAQSMAPEARVVYADNDPMVLTYARALLDSGARGATAYIHGDAQDPASILAEPELTGTLDLTKPTVLSLNALLHFMPDRDAVPGILATFLEALPSGSALAMTYATADFAPEGMNHLVANYNKSGIPIHVRTYKEILALYDGLELLEPGLVSPPRWHPEEVRYGASQLSGMVSDTEVALWGGVAIKP